jgi:hypothetical protein
METDPLLLNLQGEGTTGDISQVICARVSVDVTKIFSRTRVSLFWNKMCSVQKGSFFPLSISHAEPLCVLQGVETVKNEYFITVENKERLKNIHLANIDAEVNFTSLACTR